MSMMSAKCPTCGAVSQIASESASAVTACPKCGAMYVPEECEVSAASMSAEAAARAERLARQSEAHLRQIADDLRYITQYLKGVRLAGHVIGVALIVGLVVVFVKLFL